MSNNINAASKQWASRPDDQRYLSLDDLQRAVANRRDESWTVAPRVRDLEVIPTADDLALQCYDPTDGQDKLLRLNNWSFGQLSTFAGAPAGYLRKLPPELAAINVGWGLQKNPAREDALILGRSNGDNEMRAITSQSYGRIWDAQVVDAVQKMNDDGNWQIPAASYATSNPKRATTLYASDRDVFIFLVDPDQQIEFNGEQLFRGFYTWNSEVGSATFGLCTFLYRYICDNRIIWGASDVHEVRIRHTGGAPDRFAYEGKRYLERYAREDTTKLLAGIDRAQNAKLEYNEGKGETVTDWLAKRGFTKTEAKGAIDMSVAEMGRPPENVWEAVQGVTAYARVVPHTDTRVNLEARAGKLLSKI